jgi:hypothetical protein
MQFFDLKHAVIGAFVFHLAIGRAAETILGFRIREGFVVFPAAETAFERLGFGVVLLPERQDLFEPFLFARR